MYMKMDFKEKITKIIDFLFKQRDLPGDYISVDIKRLVSDDFSLGELEDIFQDLKANNCFSFENMAGRDSFSSLENVLTVVLKKTEYNFLKLFEYREKLLGNIGRSIVKPIALEQIARIIGDSDNANGLIKLLENAGVPNYLIVYPNTKWRMIDDVFRVLATSNNPDANKLLFTILEEFCHPLTFGGDKTRAIEMQDNFSGLLEYDGYCFSKNRIVEVTEEVLQEIAIRREKRVLESHEAMGGTFDVFGEFFQPKAKVKDESQKLVPINITIQNQNIQNIPKSENITASHDTSSIKEEKYEDKVIFTQDENLKYKEMVFYTLPALQKQLCRRIYKDEVNTSIKTIDVEEYVYGGEVTKDRQDKLKKLVERLNETIKNEFKISEFVKYSTETIRRLI